MTDKYCHTHRMLYPEGEWCPKCLAEEPRVDTLHVTVTPEMLDGRPKENPKMVQAQKSGKAPLELVPYHGLAAVARVMASGAEKYGVKNWRVDDIRATTYIGAIARHALLEWAEGVDADKDSGEHPLAHVAACCLIVMDALKRGTLIDDRLHAESKTPPVERKE